MNIRLSSPDLFFDKRVEQAARDAGCHAWIKWAEPSEVRFILTAPPQFGPDYAKGPFPVPSGKDANYATDAQHDQVIARLFMEDPHAIVRTARVTYKGAAEFYAAKQGLAPCT